MKKLDLVGRRFGKLLVLEEADRKNGRITWRCTCDCGVECVKLSSHLLAGRTRSCKCLQSPLGAENKRWNGCGNITGAMLYRIRRDALRRNLMFEVAAKDLWDKYKAQAGICAISGLSITLPATRHEERFYQYTASLDRIDSSIGYLTGNIQWVHKTVNRMKWDMSQADLIEWCTIIVNNQGEECKSG